jgi:hypothetical protein
MNSAREDRLERELSADISEMMAALWTRFSGVAPSSTKTVVRGDTVTITIGGVVGGFEQMTGSVPGAGLTTGPGTAGAYERQASATVSRLAHREVLSITTDHDRDSDVATEVFELGGSPRRARLRKPARAAPR